MTKIFKLDYIDNLNEYMLYLAYKDSDGMVSQVKDMRYHICTKFDKWDYSIDIKTKSFAKYLEKDIQWVEEYLRQHTDHFHINRFKNKKIAEKVKDTFNAILLANELTK